MSEHKRVSAKPAMSTLSTTIVVHNAVRLIDCCACGAKWEEHWIGAALIKTTMAIGPLCPRCIQRSPSATALRFRLIAQRMHAEIERRELKWQELPNLEDEELQANILRLHRRAQFWQSSFADSFNRTAALREHTDTLMHELQILHISTKQLNERIQKQRLKSARFVAAQSEEPHVIAEFLDASTRQLLEVLANDCPHVKQWPTTVSNMIDAESERFVAQYSELRDFQVRQAVQSRYQQFLAN